MPAIKKVTTSAHKKKPNTPTKRQPRSKKRMSLQMRTPSKHFTDYPLILYGEAKIGKTTFFTNFEDTYFFLGDPNESFSIYADDITCWQDFIDLSAEYLSGRHEFKHPCIDSVKDLYDYAMEYACRKRNIEHPGGLNDYGASWDAVRRTFEPPLKNLMAYQNLLVTCHDDEKEIATRSGRKFLKIVPDLSKQARSFLLGKVYNIFYYHRFGNDRFIQILGDDYITAGHRMKGHFLTKSGKHIVNIPAGKSETEAFENVLKAFNNEQLDTYENLSEGRTESKFKKGKKRIALKKKKIVP